MLDIIIWVNSMYFDAATLQTNNNNNNNDVRYDKRQPIPMPRIGRSSNDLKRQSLIPAPRIGRRDDKSSSSTRSSTIDCSMNPELCENYETIGSMMGNNNNGGGGGGGGGNLNDQENLIEPLDIQLRAAFIPRLGKRSSHSSMLKLPQSRIINDNNNNNELIDYVKMYGNYLPRQQQQQQQHNQQQQQSNIDINDDNNDDQMMMANNNDYLDDLNDQQQQQQQQQQQLLLSTLLNRNNYLWNKRTSMVIPYTPRIGRAVFAPRIGKKAAFVPRIG
ncbi:hypothetical protein DERP_011604 [Dermatophagoides pteronyssinus]|uniref:Uncharacterized protein n=1 Tax=Dermatophagoides pteronyssinus TaxID=6956 RepID=A0ABQ8JWF6_DERPT|nr:hypothetical protein DERP_011604 [Dermatophagoides pteronyssinus]